MIRKSSEQDFFVFNPDTLWSHDYLESVIKMENFYIQKKIGNILLVVNKKLSFDKTLNGDFELVSNKIKKNSNNRYIYTGCQIVNKNLFSSINKKIFSINEVWNDQIKKNILYGFETKNKFFHVSNIEVYNKLLKY